MHRRHLAALACLPLLTLAACAPPTASASAPQPPSAPSQEQLAEVGGWLNDTGPTRWPASYAGTEIDVPGGALIVRRVPVDGVDAQIRAAATGIPIRFVDAVHPAARLDGWVEKIRADQAWWQRRGVTIRSSFVRYGDCAVAEVDHPARDAARFAARYPGAAVCVEQGWPEQLLPAR